MYRSSRSVAVNIREGFAKRKYEQVFIRQLVDAKGSAEETRAWLDFAVGSRYITAEEHAKLDQAYDALCAMLFSLIGKWRSTNTL
ncbi:MAG: four helix bundle protein [Candidatus Omnitrophica bacterium]|nr:four helix bundle protein [Candidatus Omnitrophota bacterium]